MILNIIILIIWIYLLSVFKRGKLTFFYFLTGSVVSFFIGLDFIEYLKPIFTFFLTSFLDFIGKATDLFSGYATYGMFFIETRETSMSLYLDLECSGLIEMLIYICLISFYPLYNVWEKIKVSFFGCFMITVFNCVRLLVIIALIHKFGSPVYAFAHAIVGRIVFYICTIILTFHIFTKPQLKKQKVGEFGYENVVK